MVQNALTHMLEVALAVGLRNSVLFQQPYVLLVGYTALLYMATFAFFAPRRQKWKTQSFLRPGLWTPKTSPFPYSIGQDKSQCYGIKGVRNSLHHLQEEQTNHTAKKSAQKNFCKKSLLFQSYI